MSDDNIKVHHSQNVSALNYVMLLKQTSFIALNYTLLNYCGDVEISKYHKIWGLHMKVLFVLFLLSLNTFRIPCSYGRH